MSEFLDQSGLSTYSTLVRSSITAARPTVTLVTLKPTGWTNKTQTVTVAGISSDEAAQRIIPIAHADSRSAYNEAGCKGTRQGEGSLTFECETVPSVDLKVWVEVKGVVDKTPPPVTETWVINETLPTPDSYFSFSINFVSNNHSYTAIIGDSDVTSYAYGKPSSEGGGAQTVYSVIGWIDSAYRTITLEQPATGDLLTWLQRNAVKQ